MQATVDAGLALGFEHKLTPAQVVECEVGIPKVVQGRLTQLDPPDLQSAQLSIPFSLAMALALGVVPGWTVLLLPLVVLSLAVAASGVGTLLAALIVAQRDFKYVLTFGVQLWMFATPSLYLPGGALSPAAQTYLPLNPAHGLVQAFRQAALGGPFDGYAFAVGFVPAQGGTREVALFATVEELRAFLTSVLVRPAKSRNVVNWIRSLGTGRAESAAPNPGK